MAILERIRVQLELVNGKFNNKLKNSAQNMEKFNQKVMSQRMGLEAMSSGQRKSTQMMDTLSDRNKSFGQVMGMSMERFKNFNQQGYKFNTLGGRTANGLRKMTHGMRGFRMEMLGVMFFGMSLTRMMGGLMGKSLEWTGVMEVMSSALGILFLPIAMQLLDWALLFLDWVGTLTEEQKKLIGTIVLIVGAFGLLLTIIGTLALGIGSVIQVFGGFGGAVGPLAAFGKAVGAIFGGISVSVLAVIAIIVAIVVGMYIAWKENFMGMKDTVSRFIEGVKQYFSGLIEFFKGIFNLIKALLTGDSDLLVKALIQIWEGFKNMVIGLIKMTVNGIIAIFTGIVQVVWNILKAIGGAFLWLYNYLVGHSLIPDMVKAIVNWFLWLPKQVWNIIKSIATFFYNMFVDVIKWAQQLPGKIMNAFSSLINWFKKLPGVVWNAVKNIGKKVADAFKGMIPDWMMKIFKGGKSFLGSTVSKAKSWLGFAEGGIVPGPKGAPVPAIVHGGERIIPNGKDGFGGSISQNITINANVSNDYDVRKLADQLNRYWVSDINKMTKSK